MKKVFLYLALFLLVFASTNIIFGQNIGNQEVIQGAQIAGQQAATFFTTLLQPLYGQPAWAAKILLGILLFLIVQTVVPYLIGDSRIMGFSISLIIAIIAIYAIPDVFFSAIIAQYGIMGATILSIIPFAIILILSVLVKSALLARVIWIVYIIYYFVLYIYLTVQVFISEGRWLWVSTDIPNTLPYIGAIIAGIFIFFFIKNIRDIWFKGQLDALRETGEQIAQEGGLLHSLQKKELKESYGVTK